MPHTLPLAPGSDLRGSPQRTELGFTEGPSCSATTRSRSVFYGRTRAVRANSFGGRFRVRHPEQATDRQAQYHYAARSGPLDHRAVVQMRCEIRIRTRLRRRQALSLHGEHCCSQVSFMNQMAGPLGRTGQTGVPRSFDHKVQKRAWTCSGRCARAPEDDAAARGVQLQRAASSKIRMPGAQA